MEIRKHVFPAFSLFCLWGLLYLHHWLSFSVEMSDILWSWGGGVAWTCSVVQQITEFSWDYKSTEIIAVTHKLSLALKKGKVGSCQLRGCSLFMKPKIAVAPCFSAFIWTAIWSFLDSLLGCLTASFLVNYAFQTRKQCTCASLKPLKCFSSTFQSWKCKKCHPKSDQWSLEHTFPLLRI